MLLVLLYLIDVCIAHNFLFLFQSNVIVKASASLKVLAELPIIVVLMYQVCYIIDCHNEYAS